MKYIQYPIDELITENNPVEFIVTFDFNVKLYIFKNGGLLAIKKEDKNSGYQFDDKNDLTEFLSNEQRIFSESKRSS